MEGIACVRCRDRIRAGYGRRCVADRARSTGQGAGRGGKGASARTPVHGATWDCRGPEAGVGNRGCTGRCAAADSDRVGRAAHYAGGGCSFRHAQRQCAGARQIASVPRVARGQCVDVCRAEATRRVNHRARGARVERARHGIELGRRPRVRAPGDAAGWLRRPVANDGHTTRGWCVDRVRAGCAADGRRRPEHGRQDAATAARCVRRRIAAVRGSQRVRAVNGRPVTDLAARRGAIDGAQRAGRPGKRASVRCGPAHRTGRCASEAAVGVGHRGRTGGSGAHVVRVWRADDAGAGRAFVDRQCGRAGAAWYRCLIDARAWIGSRDHRRANEAGRKGD